MERMVGPPHSSDRVVVSAVVAIDVLLKTQDYCLAKYSNIPRLYHTKGADPKKYTSSSKTS